MQIQEHTSHMSPGGQLRDVDLFRQRGKAGGEQFVGRLGIVVIEMTLRDQQLTSDFTLRSRRLALEHLLPSPTDSFGVVTWTIGEGTSGQSPRGFDIGWIVEQNQSLLGQVRSVAFRSALFATGGIEGQQAWMQERTLPPYIEARRY